MKKAIATPKGQPTKHVELTQAEVDSRLAEELANTAEQEANAWLHSRIDEYPTMEEIIHAMLDGTLDEIQVKRAAIKTKYPKPTV